MNWHGICIGKARLFLMPAFSAAENRKEGPMPGKNARLLMTLIAALSMAGGVNAADLEDRASADDGTAALRPSEAGRQLARLANTLAAEDAIAAVHRAMKHQLDRRLNDEQAPSAAERSRDSR